MKRTNAKIFIFGSAAVLTAFLFFAFQGTQNRKTFDFSEKAEKKESAETENISAFSATEKNRTEKIDEETALPESVLLPVPFLSQAPFAEWDFLHENACEEASLIMLKYFFGKNSHISKKKGEKEIQELVAYETKNGYGPSISLEELVRIAEKHYGMKSARIESANAAEENIKKEIASGRPVILPAAGKILPNPNFRNGGPNYHMLVVKGYDARGFITNDPGTRKGENFRYSFSDLMNAIRDWNAEDIYQGRRAYLVFD